MYQEPKKLAELQLEFETFVVISTRVKEDLEFFGHFQVSFFCHIFTPNEGKIQSFQGGHFEGIDGIDK